MPSSYPPNLMNRRLEQVGRTLREAADRIYQQECGLDIDHIRILRIVSAVPGQSVNWVVKEANFDRTVVSRLISKLVNQDLLERTISPDDARQFLLRTTAAGEQLAQKAIALGDELNRDLLSILGPKELKVFENCLAKLGQWQPKRTSVARQASPSDAPREALKRARA